MPGVPGLPPRASQSPRTPPPTAAYVVRSSGVMPKSRPSNNRDDHTAPPMPIARPAPATIALSRTTSAWTWRRRAPRAMRMPISRVRCTTRKRDHAVDADSGQSDRDHRVDPEHDGVQARPGVGVRHETLQRRDVVDEGRRVQLRNQRAQARQQRSRIAIHAHDHIDRRIVGGPGHLALVNEDLRRRRLDDGSLAHVGDHADDLPGRERRGAARWIERGHAADVDALADGAPAVEHLSRERFVDRAARAAPRRHRPR